MSGSMPANECTSLLVSGVAPLLLALAGAGDESVNTLSSSSSSRLPRTRNSRGSLTQAVKQFVAHSVDNFWILTDLICHEGYHVLEVWSFVDMTHESPPARIWA